MDIVYGRLIEKFAEVQQKCLGLAKRIVDEEDEDDVLPRMRDWPITFKVKLMSKVKLIAIMFLVLGR